MKEKNIKKLKELFVEFEKDIEKNSELKKTERGSAMYVDDDGIIHVDLRGNMDSIMKYSDILMGYSEKYTDETIKSLEIRILAKIPNIFKKIPSITVRRKIKQSLVRSQKNIKLQKMALCGGGVVAKTVISFILVALGMKDTKYFKTEEEALKWLKED